jgi:hypothetical protein
MGHNQPLELSEKEKKDLSIGLLREWWINSTQTLVEVAGSEKALELLRPYFVHMGKAGGINIKALTNYVLVERPAGAWIQRCGVGGKPGRTYRAGDGTVIEELVACETSGKSREACICLCSYAMSAGAEETNSNNEYVLIGSLSSGDPECRWLTKWKDRPPQVAPIDDFVTNEFDVPPKELTDDLSEYLGLSMIGESVMNCTRAFIDFVGSDRTKEMLCDQMRRSGQSFAKMFTSSHDQSIIGVVAIMNVFEFLNKMYQREASLSASHIRAEGTITKCPFSDAPNEFCLQHESFCNGICEALNPSYEFSYDRMMTKGDMSCHWNIRKKGEVEKGNLTEEQTQDEPLKVLAMRFAKGEITEEELESKITYLRKLGLMK